MKDVTIQDIANYANVSKSTVSRVLNNTSAVHADKRQAVLDATKKLGFKPNIFARSLASGRSMTIGVLTQIIGSPFYDAIAQGVVAGVEGTGYSPIFVDGRWQLNSEIEAIRALQGRRVDGLVLVGGNIPGDELAKLCDRFPTVVVARELPPKQHHCIFMDNVEGGYRATKHLIEQGHRAIASIRGIDYHPDSIDRHEGYQKALKEAGIKYDPELILPGDFSAESGVAAINALMEKRASFTAVFAENDMMAIGAQLALHRHGRSVPGDVSIVGFDDQNEAEFLTPPLTTVRQPGAEMGALAGKAILSLINGQPFESKRLQGELKIRESVAPLDAS